MIFFKSSSVKIKICYTELDKPSSLSYGRGMVSSSSKQYRCQNKGEFGGCSSRKFSYDPFCYDIFAHLRKDCANLADGVPFGQLEGVFQDSFFQGSPCTAYSELSWHSLITFFSWVAGLTTIILRGPRSFGDSAILPRPASKISLLTKSLIPN